MADGSSEARDAERRREIVEAARQCFLQFGYAKTSLDDIAKRAGISRPLIYRKFKNKEDVFSAVYEQLLEGLYPHVEQVLAGRGTAREKLLGVYEHLLMEPWEMLEGAPMAAEFYEACSKVLPEVEAKHERLRLKYTQAVLGSKELSEVFMLAVDGLGVDVPSARVLRRRLQVLVERFV
jgi:AcrR family transcriptional regulator